MIEHDDGAATVELAGDVDERTESGAWGRGGRPMDTALFDPLEFRHLRNRLLGRLFRVEPPTKVGRYHALERIGVGAMGVVYAAYDEQLDRKVALKLLRSGSTPSAEARVRMLREAKALARLSHPNVVQVHDAGELDGDVFVAMEYVVGQTLRQWCVQTTPSPAEILAAFAQAGAGLAAAHRAGIVHRDFKPDNVLVGGDGRVRVLDFGLAVAAGTEAPPSTDAPRLGVDDGLTATGVVLGTPAYMAPEQLAGDAVDARADQFAFAVALWEALFGARPFIGDTLENLRQASLAGPGAAPRLAGLPSAVVRALVRALSVAPEDRFESMEALLRELDPRPRRRRILLAAALTAIVPAIAWWSVPTRISIAGMTESIAVAGQYHALAAEAERALDEEVLARLVVDAERILHVDPTRAIARLQALPSSHWDERALRVARGAVARGIASHVLELHPGEALHGTVGDAVLLTRANSMRLWNPDRGTSVEIGDGVPLLARQGAAAFVLYDGQHALTSVDAEAKRTVLRETPDFDAAIVEPGGHAVAVIVGTSLTAYRHDGATIGTLALEGIADTANVHLLADGVGAAWVDAEARVHVQTFDGAHHRLRPSAGRDDLVPIAVGEGAIVAAPDGSSLFSWSLVDGRRRALGPRLHKPLASPDGRWVAAWSTAPEGEHGCAGALLDLRSGGKRLVCGMRRGVTAQWTFSPDSRALGVLDGEGKVRVWDLGSGLDWQPRAEAPAKRIAFRANGDLVTEHVGEIRLWPGFGPGAALDPSAAHGRAEVVAFLDDAHVTTSSHGGLVEIWPVNEGQPRAVALPEGVVPRALSGSGGGHAAIATPKSVVVFDSAGLTLAEIRTATQPSGTAVSSDGRYVMWLERGAAQLHDLQTGTTRGGDALCPSCRKVAPNGRLGFSRDGTVAQVVPFFDFAPPYAWNVADGSSVALATPDGQVTLMSPDRQLIAVERHVSREPDRWVSFLHDVPTQRSIDAHVVDGMLAARRAVVADDGRALWPTPEGMDVLDLRSARVWSVRAQPPGDFDDPLEDTEGIDAHYPAMALSPNGRLVALAGPYGVRVTPFDAGPDPQAMSQWAHEVTDLRLEAALD